MAKISKRARAIAEKVDRGKVYAIEEAAALLSELSKTAFAESVDVAVNLGIDPRRSDQNVRGATTLPHGSGKEARVAVFAQDDNAEEAVNFHALDSFYQGLYSEGKFNWNASGVCTASVTVHSKEEYCNFHKERGWRTEWPPWRSIEPGLPHEFEICNED